MKKKFSLITTIMILIMSLITFTACNNNDGNTDNNIDDKVPQNTGQLLYTLKSDDTYEVSGYTDTIYDLIIPETYNGKPVTSIKGFLFFDYGTNKGYETLRSITISNNITNIEDKAFYYCGNLTKISVKDGNTQYHSKNNCLIKTSENKLILGCKNSIIPDYITSIGENAFLECKSLTNIIIPNNVTSIGNKAFLGCVNLTNIIIPNSMTDIGEYVFYNCSSLKSIKIPESLTSIKAFTFYNCINLTSITIPSSITSIGQGAFYNCSSLTSITIPSSVVNIGSSAFFGCTNLDNLQIDENNSKYKSDGNCILSKNGQTLIQGFENSIIPDYITNIGKYAFAQCIGLTNIIIPKSVTNIDENAFEYCIGLTNIIIPKSVTSIGWNTFLGCSDLTIKCETSSKPSEWDSNWNPDNRPVEWNYKS